MFRRARSGDAVDVPLSLCHGRLTSLFFWDSHLLRRTLASLFWAELSRIARGLQRGHIRLLSVLLHEVILASVCHWAVRMYLAAGTREEDFSSFVLSDI